MPEGPFDPYAPPRWSRPSTRAARGRRRWAEGLGRAAAVVLGFGLVADPTSLPGVHTAAGRAIGGHVFARGVGLALLGVGDLPWRRGKEGPAEGEAGGPGREEL